MAYMLSAQLAAMVLNVREGFVSESSIIYAPGTSSGDDTNNGPLLPGFATIGALITEATNLLAADGNTPSGDPNRAPQEAVKNALDNANNNLNFVQATPCAFSFPTTSSLSAAGTTAHKRHRHRHHGPRARRH
jgi:hypothetical protein